LEYSGGYFYSFWCLCFHPGDLIEEALADGAVGALAAAVEAVQSALAVVVRLAVGARLDDGKILY
jgi:hypothetical protein